MTFPIGTLVINTVGGGVLAKVVNPDDYRGILLADLNDASCIWAADAHNVITASKGAMLVKDGYEYFLAGQYLHKAHISFDLDVTGYRNHAQFACNRENIALFFRRLGVMK